MMTPINRIPQAWELLQMAPYHLKQQMLYETMGEDKERFDLKQPMLYETMAPQPLIKIAGQQVPRDVIVIILSKLSPKELLKVGLVCKLWHQIASMNRLWRSYPIIELFPFAPVIDRDVWYTYVDLEQHGLEFEQKGHPGVEGKRHYFEFLRMASEVEKGHGISILTLPKGLSLSKIIAFARAPKVGNAARIEVYRQKIVEEHGNIELKETVTVAITNGVFENSRDKYVSRQIELIKGLNCEMPQVVAVMALAILRFISSDPNSFLPLFEFDLYGDNPWSYTCCVEIVEDWPVLVGGDESIGFCLTFNEKFDRDSPRLCGQRKFAVNNP